MRYLALLTLVASAGCVGEPQPVPQVQPGISITGEAAIGVSNTRCDPSPCPDGVFN